MEKERIQGEKAGGKGNEKVLILIYN